LVVVLVLQIAHSLQVLEDQVEVVFLKVLEAQEHQVKVILERLLVKAVAEVLEKQDMVAPLLDLDNILEEMAHHISLVHMQVVVVPITLTTAMMAK
jgi:hypothetical protein